MAFNLLTAVTLLGLVHSTRGYALGAPEETCITMRPGHRVNQTDPSSDLINSTSGVPYFKIMPNKTLNILPNEEVTVHIVSDANQYFEGFLIQVRDKLEDVTDSSSIVTYGTFMGADNRSQPLCSQKAMTHNVHEHMDNITLIWTAPSVAVRNVVFKATVVKGYSTFFMNVKSEVLNPSDRAAMLLPSMILLCVASVMAVGHGRPFTWTL